MAAHPGGGRRPGPVAAVAGTRRRGGPPRGVDRRAGRSAAALAADRQRRRRRARRPGRFVGVGPHAAAGRRRLGPGGGRGAAERPRSSRVAPVVPATIAGGGRWFACLVPAFDAGAARPGAGALADQPLRPAWTSEDHHPAALLPLGVLDRPRRRFREPGPAPAAVQGRRRQRRDTDGRHGQAAHRRRRWPGGPPRRPPGADRRDGRRAAGRCNRARDASRTSRPR